MTPAALDIECEDWDRFTVGALRYPDGDTLITWDPGELFEAVRDYPGDIWTWAGARYDSLWVAETAAILDVPCVARLSGGVVSLKVGAATVRDGYRLYPASLKKAAKLAGVSKETTGLPCRCRSWRDVKRMRELISASGRDPDEMRAWVRAEVPSCGGFCRIKQRGMLESHKRRLEHYLARDVEVTARIIEALQGFALEHDISLKSTVASSAWATLKAMGAPEADWQSWRDYNGVRDAYFGGRTEMYRQRADFIWRADIHSAYPAALINVPVPVGDYRRITGHDEVARAFEAGKPGAYSANMTVGDCFVPPLPVRGTSRLVFPTGTFHGSWSHVELQHALAVGAKLQAFTQAFVWDREERVCAPFMEKFWGLRKSLGKESPFGGWLKFFVNSPTGGFALRPQGERAYVNPEHKKACPASSECWNGALHGMSKDCCEHICYDTCGKWKPIGKRGIVWSAPQFQLSDRSHIQWAMTLTAATRVKLHQRQLLCGDGLVYSDTDSCYAMDRVAQGLGEEVGTWSDEGLGLDWYARGPKAYTYAHGGNPHTGEAPTYEYVARAKGVHMRFTSEFDTWAQGTPIALPAGVWGFKGAALRSGPLFVKRTGADGGDYTRAAMSNPRYAGSRVVADDGTTRPMSWDEYRDLAKRKEL